MNQNGYYLPKIEMKCYNAMIKSRQLFGPPLKIGKNIIKSTKMHNIRRRHLLKRMFLKSTILQITPYKIAIHPRKQIYLMPIQELCNRSISKIFYTRIATLILQTCLTLQKSQNKLYQILKAHLESIIGLLKLILQEICKSDNETLSNFQVN